MGEVYRALDTRLGRTVAVKILRSDLAADDERRRRFEREARAVSSLNDPHICALHDIGRESGIDFIVLEHLEGETLAARLKKGPLRLEESLRVAIEITRALENAHRCGVVHRDLKPANVMLTKHGVKLLDFGLARLKPGESAMPPGDASAMATRTAEPHLTDTLSVVGTVPYMAPEVLEGKEADARTDVFSAGVVIHEMITARRPFEGGSAAAIMAAIMATEPPPISRIRSEVPRSLDRVVQHCLAKNPDDRWQSSHDLALELESVQEDLRLAAEGGTPDRLAARRTRLGWIAAMALGLFGLGLALFAILRPRAVASGETIRFSITVPAAMKVEEPFWSHPAISPDGRTLAFIASSGESRGVWIRPLDALEARLLPGTDGALSPFWSPDGRSIAFFADKKLKSVPVAGGPPRVLAEIDAFTATGSWGSAGTVIYGISEAPGRDGLYRIPEAGGPPSRMPLHVAGGGSVVEAFFPQFLPDGRRFLFRGQAESPEFGIFLGTLQSETVETLPRGSFGSQVEYAAPGHLLGVKDGSLLARGFDAESGRLEEGTITVADNVQTFADTAAFTSSDNGVIAYRPVGGDDSRLIWMNRFGRTLGSIGAPAVYLSLRLSPDDRRVAVSIADPRTGLEDIWVLDLPDGIPMRLTSDVSNEFSPVWSPDGREFAFSGGVGAPHVFRRSVGEAEAEEIVPSEGHVHWVCDWSPDGRTIVYIDRDPDTYMDLWTVSLDGDRKPAPWLRTRFSEGGAQFSPDGRLIAYASNETGRYEVYVAPFRGAPGEKRRLSSAGGRNPRWRGDGTELFYLGPPSGIYSVSIDPSSGTPLGAPRELFKMDTEVLDYDVTKDGERFLINQKATVGSSIVANVVVNWPAGIKP